MTERFRNKYRAATTRLYGYDYTRNGAYFVTICSKKHICYFGDIVVVETGLRPVSTNSINNFSVENGNNSLNIKLSEVGKIVNECWFDLPNHYSNFILDEFIIMPNHIHGIILIQNYTGKKQIHGLSEFVRAFKSFSSRKIHNFQKTTLSEIWQSRFYDHIIRSENELNRIREYIKANPRNWLNDENYFDPKNI